MTTPAPWICGDCGDEITPGNDATPKAHLNDGTPQCMGRDDAARRKPEKFAYHSYDEAAQVARESGKTGEIWEDYRNGMWYIRLLPDHAPDPVEAAAAEIAESVIADARGSGSDPIVFVTGNSYMPPLRSFAAAEQVYQADEDGEDFGRLQELIEARLAEADVALECPDYDNALYAVDLGRFEYVDDPGDHETLQQDWQPKADCCPDCTTGEKS